ncbi:MAG: DUF3999 family protein [Bacteroidales bacterium]
MKLIIKIFCLVSLSYSVCYGQMDTYDYKRELKEVSQQWHKIVLPDDIFSKTSDFLSDIRIYGLTADNDTIEVPYIIESGARINSRKEIRFNRINEVHDNQGYYYTFEIPSKSSIDYVDLDFNEQNFNWTVDWQGSQDMNKWYTLLDNYRMLSIKNESTDFQFTKLEFPNSKYRYYRLFIRSKTDPKLRSASLWQEEAREAEYRTYTLQQFSKEANKQSKQSEINIELQHEVFVNTIKVDIADTFDYYRPVSLQYLADSTKTEQGWIYNYRGLGSGILSSKSENRIRFGSTKAKSLKIIIYNQDNTPLKVNTVHAEGYVYKLTARFTKLEAKYFLVYGRQYSSRPVYDIAHFSDKIPTSVEALSLGDEVAKLKDKSKTTDSQSEPLISNDGWLWVVMIVIILLLGFATLQMMKRRA